MNFSFIRDLFNDLFFTARKYEILAERLCFNQFFFIKTDLFNLEKF